MVKTNSVDQKARAKQNAQTIYILTGVSCPQLIAFYNIELVSGGGNRREDAMTDGMALLRSELGVLRRARARSFAQKRGRA
jgi:hypothetical protein